MKKLLRYLYSTKFILFLTLLANIVLFAAVVIVVGVYAYYIFAALSVAVLIIIIYFSRDFSQYKMTWVAVVLLFPLFGCMLYVYMKGNKSNFVKRKLWRKYNDDSERLLIPQQSVYDELRSKNLKQYKESEYLQATSRMPLCKNTSTKYFKDGIAYFDALFEELKNAKKFILIEYFIFAPGQLFDKFTDILKQKAEEGVEIKLLYDDFGCVDKFGDRRTILQLRKYGIEVHAFNRIKFFITAFVNYRSHRKIAVIDGKTAFTGGINVADEYANLKTRFGYWKDTGVQITGDAVWNMTITFLTDWQFTANYELKPEIYYVEQPKIETDEFVQPFDAGPLDKESIAKNSIINILNSSVKYFYISSPYFVIDSEFRLALKLAAKSGVDVRILFPSVPDKKTIYCLARSFFRELIIAGVKIYSYTPGFNHAKMLVCDDETAMVSSINLDFRSLYLHFENGVLIHNSPTVFDVKADFEEMFEKDTKLVTLEDMQKRKFGEKIVAAVLSLFSVLL